MARPHDAPRQILDLEFRSYRIAVGCYLLASYFHGQYAAANTQVSHALQEPVSRVGYGGSLKELPNPETYFGRAEATFRVAVWIWIASIMIAVKMRHWMDWLAVLIVAGITLAIPMSVLWRS
jgi:hypothetical protein